MLLQIFLFEIRYRLRRPAFYVYFVFIFGFSLLSFANGALPVVEKELYNAPVVLALYSSMMSLFLMLVSSAIMGVPLYRDIEHNTKEYYLSYPITKAGYFWGRYLGSWVFVVLTAAAVYLGAYLGSKLGPAMGWTAADRYGANHAAYYFYPFFTLLLPTLFFTSSLFFGLVAIFRNVKVIYSSGLFLFLGFIIGNFFLNNIHNPTVIYLSDPFLINALRMQTASYSPDQLNSSIVKAEGLLLWNRILWVSVGGLVLLYTYWRFSFERFFSAGAEKKKSRKGAADVKEPEGRMGIRAVFRSVNARFERSYFRKTLYSLTRIEVLNIIRDNYFWIILSGGLIFLSFVFWHGPNRYGVPDYPRTSFFMFVFGDIFSFFIFLIIIFYTGETVHREKVTRYSFINDALPPPTWVLNSAKLLSLCALAVFLSLTPILLGLGIQLIKGYTYFNLPLYFSSLFVSILPRLIEMVLLCYAVHIVVNNKFAAHGIAITLWVLMYLVNDFNYFTYNLLLYSYTPFSIASDMDGFGHMLQPILWYTFYWSVAGAALVVIGSLFYTRGMGGSLKEKVGLARQRFRGASRLGTVLLLAVFLATGGYIYYNVSYLNQYLTHTEEEEQAVAAEKKLKRYGELPLPKVSRIQLYTDLYPDNQTVRTRAYVTLVNKGARPIDSLLLDGDKITEFTFKYNGVPLGYTCPLSFPRGKFNVFRPVQEPSDYRLYVFPTPLLPGDSAKVEVQSLITHQGFENSLYASNRLHNGTFLKYGGLPAMGYDEGDEIGNNDTRKKYGLPKKVWRELPADDSAGRRNLQDGEGEDLVSLDITVSAPVGQTVIAPGKLEREWRVAGGRHYFHYVQDHPAVYMPYGMAAARFAVLRDTVQAGKQPVNVEIYYHPEHGANLSRFLAAYKDGLRTYSQAFGPYPFSQARLVETSGYSANMFSFPGTVTCTERTGWNADFREPGLLDYIYYSVADQLAHQWWGGQVAPNQTVGSRVLSDGLSKYAAIMLVGKKYGKDMQQRVLETVGWDYDWGRRNNFYKENDLLHANKGYEWNAKAGMVLYGLASLIGEDSLNAALRELRDQFALRDGGIYAGSYDLYRVLQRHVPDSFRYFLEDSWEKVAFYDNKVVGATATPLGKGDAYKVVLTVDVKKVYMDSTGKEQAATGMNDFVDIGVYAGAAHAGVGWGGLSKALYLKRLRLSAGRHTLELTVQGKPGKVAIDPERKLMDRNREDNIKELP
ncbi:MAG TPA: hypothetical protein VL832_08940 [Puia sp.]|nr:hypothetical protein [Puia sp.]